jgi:hypothetical protein
VQVILEVNLGINIIPDFPVKGFVHLNKCSDCKAVGYYTDLSRFDPCKNCGGYTVVPYKPGKLVDGKWNVRVGIEKEPQFYKKKNKKLSL